MDWKPTTCFHKILQLDKPLKAVYGGSSAGKTVAILPYLYQCAVDNPGEVISIFSDTLANLKDGAMRDFIQILQGTDRWDGECWNKTESKYRLHNGSVIEFIGADMETKVRGPRRDRCYINEANRVKYDVFQQLQLRTRKETILDWNPSGHFWYNEHIKDIIDHDELVVTYLDNEYCGEGVIRQMKNLEEASKRSEHAMNLWRVYGLGEWGTVSGACINDYKVIEEIPDGYKLWGIGLDFGNNDPNAGVALYKHAETDSFIFDEILYKNKIGIPEISKTLKPFDTNIYADYAWPQTINELRRLKHKIFKCKKGPDSIKAGIDLINTKDVSITSRSKNILDEVGLYAYKLDKDGHHIDGKFVGPDHLVDAMRYVLSRAVGKRKAKIYKVNR